MIAHLKGLLALKSSDQVIVDVNGVGYQVFIPLSTFYKLPALEQKVSLRVHTQVSEDSFKLFGFFSEEELKVFQTLITINKVGPKLALAILSGIAVKELVAAVRDKDIARLSHIPGVGKKTAERLSLELKDKLPQLKMDVETESGDLPGDSVFDDARSALINLGYKKPDVDKILKQFSDKDESPDLETIIKESLKRLP